MRKIFLGSLLVLSLSNNALADENTPILQQSLTTQVKNAAMNAKNFLQLNVMTQLGQLSTLTINASTALDSVQQKLAKTLGNGPLAKETAHVARQCVEDLIGKLGLKIKLPNIGTICGVNLTDFVYGYILDDLNRLFGIKSHYNIDVIHYLSDLLRNKEYNNKIVTKALLEVQNCSNNGTCNTIKTNCENYNKITSEDEKKKYLKKFKSDMDKLNFELKCLFIKSPVSKELMKAYLKSKAGGNVFDLPNSAKLQTKQKELTENLVKKQDTVGNIIVKDKRYQSQDNNFLEKKADTVVLVPLPIFTIEESKAIKSKKDKEACTIVNENVYKKTSSCKVPTFKVEMISSNNIIVNKNSIVKEYNKGIDDFIKFRKKFLSGKDKDKLERNLKTLKITEKTKTLNYPQLLMLAQIYEKTANESYQLDAGLAMQRRMLNEQQLNNIQLFVLNNQIYNVQKHTRAVEEERFISMQRTLTLIHYEQQKQTVVLTELLKKLINK